MGEYIFTIGNKDYAVDVKQIEGDKATVKIDGKEILVNIKQLGHKEPERKPRKKSRVDLVSKDTNKKDSGKSKKPVKVTAPIPGVILKILVREGDTVKAGQDILIMEAMKMENQVQASRSGRIGRINVRQDDAVQQDDVLLEIEPS